VCVCVCVCACMCVYTYPGSTLVTGKTVAVMDLCRTKFFAQDLAKELYVHQNKKVKNVLTWH